MKLSGDDDLGTSTALIVALAFPLGWGLYELLKHRKFNFIALLGLISALLTGGIGLLQRKRSMRHMLVRVLRNCCDEVFH